jgi:NADPH2:quinone reductase
MVQAIRVHETGSAEVLTWEHVELGEPGPGEARIRHTAIGLNFIDTYFRSGLYPAPDGVPFIPGNEGAGIVQTVGDGVSHIKPGDRVAYVGPLGAYAQERIIPADRLVVIPDGIDDKAAAGMMLKGMTAQYLLRQTFNVGPETTLLFHAAAGGVGLIAGQWAAHLGATVIGTAGSQDKVDLAKANGYQHVINYRTENFVERVKEITGGKGCDVVYDSVGKDTYPGIAGLPEAAWAVGQLRSVLRPDPGLQSRFARTEGIPLCNPANALQLYRDPRTAGDDVRRSV